MIAIRALRVLFIPAGVILSTMFGGGYGSGRETATFVSTYGPWGGVLATVVMAVVFGLILAVCLELARVFEVFEYASFSRVFLGKAAVVYEVVLALGLLLALGVGATAAGSTLEDHFGLPRIVGTAGLMVGVIALTFFGRRVVEWSMTVTAGLLLTILAGLLVVVFNSAGNDVADAFSADSLDTGFWRLGGLNGALNAAFLPLIVFIARNIETRSEAILSGIFGGLIFALPALIFHLSFMALYPSILDQDVPSYTIAETYGGTWFLNAFVLVLFILIAQTSVGILQGLIERIDVWAIPSLGRPLTRVEHAGFSALVLVTTVGLSVIGLVTLVASGYGLLSIVFVAIFTIPLLTLGVRRIWQAGRDRDPGPLSQPLVDRDASVVELAYVFGCP